MAFRYMFFCKLIDPFPFCIFSMNFLELNKKHRKGKCTDENSKRA